MSLYTPLFPILAIISCHFFLLPMIQNSRTKDINATTNITTVSILFASFALYYSYKLLKSNDDRIYSTINPRFSFTAPSSTMPGVFDRTSSSRKRSKHVKNTTPEKVLTSRNKNKEMTKQPQSQSLNKYVSIPALKEEQWTIVTENKKTKRASKSMEIKELSHIQEPPATIKKTMENGTTVKASTKKGSNKKKNRTTSSVNTKTTCKPPTSWADIVNENKKEHEIEEASQISADEMDLPALSDSESMTGTIESPCLSVRSLPDQVQIQSENITINNYYSLFSTGFDFGTMITKEENKNIPSFSPKVPSTDIQRKQSILDLLDQDQQAETTITPACFSYFGEMMMSTSLYPRKEHWSLAC